MAFGLNREVERRANELMAINKREAGGTLRIGGGWRSEKAAYDAFFYRYTYVGAKPSGSFLPGRLKFFPGDSRHARGWYTLNSGEIPCATPGNSYHTDMPPDALEGDTGAVAIDWVNELAWMAANAHRVGLVASKIPGELHHTQPVEYPPARRDFDPALHKLTVWPLQKDDTMKLIRPVKDTTVLRLGADGTCVWVKDGNVLADIVAEGLVESGIVEVSRRSLTAWTLKGPAPVYSPTADRPDKTVPADFAKWEP